MPQEPSNNGNRDKAAYKETLRLLQIELVKAQKHIIDHDERLLVIFEGRDAAGKDGVIKRITAHLSPRDTRIVALSKPSDREQGAWYFQRYVAHLPVSGETVLFNRSWYNRAGVERVMGFCDQAELERFMSSVVPFEHMLANAGIKLVKYYLDITKATQEQRLKDREDDPLRQWKISPVDAVALDHWDDYTLARNDMFARTHNIVTPWFIVDANDKRKARLAVIRHLLGQVSYSHKNIDLLSQDGDLVSIYDPALIERGVIAG